MKLLIVDNRIEEKMERALLKEGFYLIKLPPDPCLSNAIASHPDTVLFYLNGEIITTADYCEAAAYIFSDIREFKPDVKISFTADIRGSKYPSDCIFNALVIGNKIFCKSDSISRAVVDLAEKGGYEIVHTAQGYPACSVLAFGNSAITSDRGLAAILSDKGVNVLLISTGGISLPPYEYGFIGGASGVVGRKIYFFGDLDTHPDSKAILKAIEAEGYTAISLCDGGLRDMGGIIAL